MMNLLNCLRVLEKQWKQFRRSGQAAQAPQGKKCLPSLEVLEDRTVLTVYTVNSLADNNAGSGNTGDLRYVINRANRLNTGTRAAPDVIQFTGVTLTENHDTIHVGGGAAGRRPLPALTAKAIIDGTTAGGFNNLTGLLITLDGSSLRGGANGLILRGGHATVSALKVMHFPGNGVVVQSSGNTLGGDQVGFDAAGQRSNPAGRITSPLPPIRVTPVFVRPPEGNVISANGRNGVVITRGANRNLLQGNFIGTDVTGTRALGNRGHGVLIVNANRNQLLGTTPVDQDNPFVFYNVISGNRGHGLVLDNSDFTTVYANMFGLGADNRTPLGNRLDGVLIKGTSDRTKLGGNIPLGNVSAANGRHGVEVRDTASRTVLGNNFVGVAAFNPGLELGNRGNGMLVTSTGGRRFLRGGHFTTIILTCQFAGNGRNGIEIGGNAVGVQVSQSVLGMETNGRTPQPNRLNGIAITGNASRINIGGFEPSVAGVQQAGSFLQAGNLISGNLRNGVAIGSNARDVTIINSLIGTDTTGTSPAGNGRNGIFLDGNSGTRIGLRLGSRRGRDRNVIAFNALDGILVSAGERNSILGNSIFSNRRLGIGLVGGGNANQPFPVLTSAKVRSDGTTRVAGLLLAQPNTTYQVELFASPSSRPGNGRTFLRFVNVRTNAAGFAQFASLTNPDATETTFLTATATSPAGNTSKFSRPVRAR